MSKSLLWFGPVSILQVQPTVPEGYKLDVMGCLGNVVDGKPTCAARADAWRNVDGSRVPTMREWLRLPAEPHVLAAFSAGGQVVKRLCLHPADRSEVRGVYLADAVYTTVWLDKPHVAGFDPLLEGLVQFALAAIEDGRPMVATASSSPNGNYPSGAQSLAALRIEIERRSGKSFCDVREAFEQQPQELKSPVRADGLENLLFVDFGSTYAHGAHPLAIAPVLLPRMLASLDV